MLIYCLWAYSKNISMHFKISKFVITYYLLQIFKIYIRFLNFEYEFDLVRILYLKLYIESLIYIIIIRPMIASTRQVKLFKVVTIHHILIKMMLIIMICSYNFDFFKITKHAPIMLIIILSTTITIDKRFDFTNLLF